MTPGKMNLLIATDVVDNSSISKLARHSTKYVLDDIADDKLQSLLPQIDALLVFAWPKRLPPESLQKMTSLKFIQSILAGVNHIPFGNLRRTVRVASNAGAYSDEVAEYAMALLLSAAKRVVEFHVSLREEKWTLRRTLDAGTEVTILKDRVLGILGFGGIGKSLVTMARGLGMKICAYSRKPARFRGITVLHGQVGLRDMLGQSDAIILALPLTNQTTRIINRKSLTQMKREAILVNIARGELVDEPAVYEHLVANPNFRYATDVWWYKDSRESLKTDHPFLSLPNFIGTPHISGPSGLATGRPVRLAVDNMLRFLEGRKPKNVVDPKEYLTSYPY